MAAIFRRSGTETWRASYYLNGKRFRHSLRTSNERIARRKLKNLEGELVTGELEQASSTPLVPFLTAFCDHLGTIRTRKSYKNDLSYLRTVLGPVCEELKPGSTVNRRHEPKKPIKVEDRFAGRHIKVRVLEELTAGPPG